MMKRVRGPFIRRHFTEPVIINLGHRFKVSDCLFEEDAKITFDREGFVEFCRFEKDIYLETEYHETPQDRKFQKNVTHGQINIIGGIAIKENFDAIKRVVHSSEQK